MQERVAIILVNYKDYAKKYLADCLASIRSLKYKRDIKLFITDNETSAESFQYISTMAPEAELILNKNNDGFAKGNNDAMQLAVNEGYEYILLLNMDAVIDSHALQEMQKKISLDKKIGAVQARLMLFNNKEKINSLGNVSHFLGFGYSLAYNDEYKNWQNRTKEDIAYPSGAAVLFRTEALLQVGFFDEELWMYNEDQDLGWRLWLNGWRSVLAEDAVVYHKYEFSKSIKKYYWMDRNRIIVIIKNYRLLSLLLILPAFLLMELGLMIFAFKSGWIKNKFSVWRYFLKPGTWKYLLQARKNTQSLRKTKDRDIVKLFSGKIWYQEIDDWKLRFINPFFNFYWQIIRRLIIW